MWVTKSAVKPGETSAPNTARAAGPLVRAHAENQVPNQGNDRRPAAGLRWFLVNAHTGKERLAQLHLTRQGYETFLPLTARRTRSPHRAGMRGGGGVAAEVLAPAAYFPGYLFARFSPEADRWRPIDGTIGVVRLVKMGAAPSPAPVGLVETLQAATDARGVLTLDPPSEAEASLHVGDRVRIVRGPFADCLAVVERLNGPQRVQVLLQMMHLRAPVICAADDLAFA